MHCSVPTPKRPSDEAGLGCSVFSLFGIFGFLDFWIFGFLDFGILGFWDSEIFGLCFGIFFWKPRLWQRFRTRAGWCVWNQRDPGGQAGITMVSHRNRSISASPTACPLRGYGRAVGDADM